MATSRKLMAKVLLLTCGASAVLYAQPGRPQTQAQDERSREARPAPAEPPREEWSVTEHTIQIGGQKIPHKARARNTLLKKDAGEPDGLVDFVAYNPSRVKDQKARPLSFLYNGGPGSASMWLHMGAFGPRRIWTVDGEFTPPAPYKLVDNAESLLDKTDLVFIDAMGTGYSRAAGKATERDFYGVD